MYTCCVLDGNIHIFTTLQRGGPYQKKKFGSPFLSVPICSTTQKLCPKCSACLVSALRFIPICNLLRAECCFRHVNPRYNFPCTSCFTCYHSPQISETFQIFHLFLSIIICNGDGCFEIVTTFVHFSR